MTVYEYRKEHPHCKYCLNSIHAGVPFERCDATNKVMGKKAAKKCPCYNPQRGKYDPIEKGGAEEQRKYFSPEEVRKMSRREVGEKYQDIMNSMPKWSSKGE